MATPSSLLVALPSSSNRISERGVAFLQMNAVSFISSMNDDMLCSETTKRMAEGILKVRNVSRQVFSNESRCVKTYLDHRPSSFWHKDGWSTVMYQKWFGT
mmetsp:Transcript_2759/g.6562  ORF Transcript_2759/g.6562 Transcript_2759/m.6562 type:complete len:101 (+) Transcript_2759:186-488(+)